MGIATRFPRAVGRVENLMLVFHAFHGSSFQQLFSGLSVREAANGVLCFVFWPAPNECRAISVRQCIRDDSGHASVRTTMVAASVQPRDVGQRKAV